MCARSRAIARGPARRSPASIVAFLLDKLVHRTFAPCSRPRLTAVACAPDVLSPVNNTSRGVRDCAGRWENTTSLATIE